jgi:hypothetical protein
MASGDIMGNVIYHSLSPKPWSANRADGTFVGTFVSLAEAESALETVIGGRSARWTQDVREDQLVSWTGVEP